MQPAGTHKSVLTELCRLPSLGNKGTSSFEEQALFAQTPHKTTAVLQKCSEAALCRCVTACRAAGTSPQHEPHQQPQLLPAPQDWHRQEEAPPKARGFVSVRCKLCFSFQKTPYLLCFTSLKCKGTTFVGVQSQSAKHPAPHQQYGRAVLCPPSKK